MTKHMSSTSFRDCEAKGKRRNRVTQEHVFSGSIICMSVQFIALLDIIITPARTAAFAVRRVRTSLSSDRTTASPARETPPRISMEPPTSPTAKVRESQTKHACMFSCDKPSVFNNRRPAVRRRAWRFHGLHRVSQLSWGLPVQRELRLEHQPSEQEAHSHRGARDLPSDGG